MDTAFTNGQMEESIKECGKTIEWKDKVSSNGIMEEYILVILAMIKEMGMGNIYILMAINIQAIGKMDSRKEQVNIYSLMAELKKVHGNKEKECVDYL